MADNRSTPGLMEKAADALTGGKLSELAGQADSLSSRLERTQTALDELYTEYMLSPWRGVGTTRLSEQGVFDPEIVRQMLRLQNYDLLGGLGGIDADRSEQNRQAAVDQARLLFRRSPLAKWGINTWTSFGLGESVGIRPVNDAAAAVWEEFQDSDRNAKLWTSDALAHMANHLKVTGNRFLTFAISEADGKATMRSVNPDEVVEIITHPEDSQTPLFYKRTWTPKGSNSPRTWYYPDWLAFYDGKLDRERPERRAERENGGIIGPGSEAKTLAEEVLPRGAKRTDKMFAADKSGTVILMLHIADNRLDEESLYGWPITTDGAPWLRSVQRFFEARLAVAMSKAQFTRRIQVGGGSRAVAHVQALRQSALQRGGTSETNPPPAPGSEDVMNQAVNVEELPMSTGSGDARADGEMFAWMALLSLGLFPHFAGIDTQRYATVRGMEKPLLVQFGRYQLFWSSQFRAIVRIVLQAIEQYGSKTFETYDADVSIDKLVELELDALTTGLSRWFRDVLNPNYELGTVDMPTMQKVIRHTTEQVLQTTGAASPEELTAAMEPSAEAVARTLENIRWLIEHEGATPEQAARLVEFLTPEKHEGRD